MRPNESLFTAVYCPPSIVGFLSAGRRDAGPFQGRGVCYPEKILQSAHLPGRDRDVVARQAINGASARSFQ